MPKQSTVLNRAEFLTPFACPGRVPTAFLVVSISCKPPIGKIAIQRMLASILKGVLKELSVPGLSHSEYPNSNECEIEEIMLTQA